MKIQIPVMAAFVLCVLSCSTPQRTVEDDNEIIREAREELEKMPDIEETPEFSSAPRQDRTLFTRSKVGSYRYNRAALEGEYSRLRGEMTKKGKGNYKKENNMIVMLRLLGRHSEALKLIRNRLKKEPGDVIYMKQMALIYFEMRKYRLAELIFKKILKKKNDSGIHNNLGLVYLKQGKKNLAVGSFIKAVEVDSGNIQARLNLGAIHLQYSNFNQAYIQYRKILMDDENNPDALLGYAVTLRGKGKFNDSESIYRRLLNRYPRWADVHFNYGVLLFESGKKRDALEHFEEYTVLKPGGSRNRRVQKYIREAKKASR